MIPTQPLQSGVFFRQPKENDIRILINCLSTFKKQLAPLM